MRKQIIALSATVVLLAGCGESTQEKSDNINTQNFVDVAKQVYAQQEGNTLATLPAPGANIDDETLYLSKVVKPRDTSVTFLQAQQGDSTLSITIDEANKYATITLNGDTANQQTVDMKTFTTKQQ